MSVSDQQEQGDVTAAGPAAGEAAPGASERTYHVGNLVYTRAGLTALFFWLLWIDFTFTLMQSAFGPILQFKLNNELNCDPRLYMFFMATAPTALGVILTPIISVKSDRHRGPRGRRIPYLLYPTPIVCILLAMMGFGNEIAAWVRGTFLPQAGLATVTIWTFGVLYLLFTVANSFLGTVFYYLFNDVVPKELIVRFFAYFRAAGTLAGMLYAFFIYGYSDKSGPMHLWFINFDYIWYPKVILVGMAAFYLVAFSIACLKVKEPEYPPPSVLPSKGGRLERLVSTVGVLLRECFSHPFYLLFFFVMTVEWMIYQANAFSNPMLKDMGLDLDVVGKANSICNVVTLALTLLTANYGDRAKAMPLALWAMIGWSVTAPIGLLFLIPDLSTRAYLWIYIAYQATHIPVGVVWGMAMWPLFMEILPKSRYGQFSSAMVICREVVAGILGSLFAGWVFATLKTLHGGTGYYNRCYYTWRMVWQILTLLCFIVLYRKWKQMGGKEGFRPPIL